MSELGPDAVVVGAGFAGLYMMHRLRESGRSVRCFEAAPDVGGTWYWNRYPGARCDIESIDYSYSFSKELEQEWDWSERYAAQPEILRYLRHVADRFDLRRDISFETRVARAEYDEVANRWMVVTDADEEFSTRWLILGVGGLSKVNVPDIPGIGSFAGTTLHTARWPAEPVDLRGASVAVIGTGSSGIQVIPELAKTAASLTVFQRTANWSLPAGNRPLPKDELAGLKAGYPERRALARADFGALPRVPATRSVFEVSEEERGLAFDEAWAQGGTALFRTYTDVTSNERANALLADFIRGKYREIVHDPAVADVLCPDDHPVGSRRACRDNGYFETFNRENVVLIDLRATPIDRIRAHGIKTTEADFDIDVLVCATGFDAGTGAIIGIDIRGRGGRRLEEHWRDGPKTYLGLCVAGFPNLFLITGPGSPSVLATVPHAIEQHVELVSDILDHVDQRGETWLEPTYEAEAAWTSEVQEVVVGTLFEKARSWYFGDNIPGKPRVFLSYVGGMHTYRRRCEQVVAAGYDGFRTGR